MKKVVAFPFIAFLFLLTSCINNKDMLTVINADGSCSRSYTCTIDSAFMVGDTAKSNPFPVDLDSNWKITWQADSANIQNKWPVKAWKPESSVKSKTILATATRNFKSVKDMADNLRLKQAVEWSNLKPQYSLSKKFRWFYTYYTYKEVYPKIETFSKIPMSKYMSNDEAEFWFSGKPDLVKGMNGVEIREFAGDIEDKYNQWFSKNLWILEYSELMNKYDSLPDKPVSRERLEAASDSIFDKYYKSVDNIQKELDLESSLNAYFKTTKFSPLWKTGSKPMKRFEDNAYNLTFLNLFGEAFNYKLVMPGTLIQPIDAVQHGDTLIWKLNAYRMVYKDLEIVAHSRKANIWAFIISVIVVVGAAASFLLKLRK